jgi:hypothetical protein
MAFRIYIVPAVGVGTREDRRRPKYFADGQITAVDATPLLWSGLDYGFEPWYIVGSDLTVAQDAFVVGQADGFALPFNLDATLTSPQVNNTKNKLEAVNIPAAWVNNTLTWRQVARTVIGIVMFMQRYSAIYANATLGNTAPLFDSNRTLNSAFGTLPQLVQDSMVQAAVSFGIPTDGLSASTTLRAIFKAMADFFQGSPIPMGGTSV